MMEKMFKKALWMGLMGSCAIAMSSCSSARTENQTPDEIKIGGSSEAYPVLEVLTAAYQTKGENRKITFLPSSQTSGGIQGVRDEAIDIGLVSRELTKAETSGKLEYRPLVKEALVLVTHSSVTGVTNLDREQLQGIYSGAINNWQDLGGPDAEIILLDVAEDENEKQLLREHYLGQTKVRSTAIIFSEDDEVIEAVATQPYSIGPVPLQAELAERPVNILSLNGIAPTPTNISNGKYKMLLTIGIVFPSQPQPPVQDFINFIFSPEGVQKIESRENGE
ncbi:MAG: substrate-binding domain-containing protein [Hormoscilla sp.]